MARPTKEGVDYFSHDVDACSKKTMTILESRFGNDGYAFWFKLLEILGASATLSFCVDNDDDWLVLVTKTRVSEAAASEILDLLARLGAIDTELWQHRIIWVQKLVDRVAQVYEKRKALIPQKPELPERKPGKRDDNAGYSDVSGAVSTQSKVKESKVNKSKDNVPLSCAEQTSAPPPEPPVITIPLNDKTEHPITQAQVDEWTELYPAVNVMQELRKYRGWAISTPAKRKTKRGIMRSINTWLTKEQDRGGARASPYRKKLDGLKYDQRPPGEDGLDRDFDDLTMPPTKRGSEKGEGRP
jgi:hypothetical protein